MFNHITVDTCLCDMLVQRWWPQQSLMCWHLRMGKASPLSLPLQSVYSQKYSIFIVEADHILTSLQGTLRGPYINSFFMFGLALCVDSSTIWAMWNLCESSTFFKSLEVSGHNGKPMCFIHIFRLVPDNSCVINSLTLVRHHTVRGEKMPDNE